jgi:polysaccharide pyruvyl transferase CsaB
MNPLYSVTSCYSLVGYTRITDSRTSILARNFDHESVPGCVTIRRIANHRGRYWQSGRHGERRLSKYLRERREVLRSRKISINASSMKTLLMGYYGMGNLGDEMMLFCLRPWLERQGFQLTVLSEQPDEITRSHGLPAIENCPLLGEWAWRTAWFKGGAWRVIRAIRESDALIIGGGDLIRDDLGWRTFFYTIEKMIVAILLRKKVYLVNAGVGEPSTRYGRIFLRWVFRRCRRIIVRDQRSEKICRQLDASAKTTLVPDIVLCLPGLLAKRPILPAETPAPKPCVVVCLRNNPNVFRLYEMTETRIQALAASLDDLIERHEVNVIFIPFQANPANGHGDTQLHERVAQAMVRADRIQLRPWTADLDEVCRWMYAARFVVAMRLHAAVLALSCDRPAILMPYDRKLREFAHLMNIPLTIEAAILDDVAAVKAVLEAAWRQSTAGGPLAKNLDPSAIWADLTLESASYSKTPVPNQ